MSEYVVYRKSDGVVVDAGLCDPADLHLKEQGNINYAARLVPAGVLNWSGSHNLQPLKAKLYADIDAEADAVELAYISKGNSIALKYLRKEQEALAWTSDSAPTLEKYPFIYREAARKGVTVASLVNVILANAHLWTPVGSKIEAERTGAKEDIRKATTFKAIFEAREINWAEVIAS